MTFFLTSLPSANSSSEPRSVQSCSFEAENAGDMEYRPIVTPSAVEMPATTRPLIRPRNDRRSGAGAPLSSFSIAIYKYPPNMWLICGLIMWDRLCFVPRSGRGQTKVCPTFKFVVTAVAHSYREGRENWMHGNKT